MKNIWLEVLRQVSKKPEWIAPPPPPLTKTTLVTEKADNAGDLST